jgi:hypothetical protein
VVLFEDIVGRTFFEQITYHIFRNYIETYKCCDNRDICLSNGVLKNIAIHLAPKKIPSFSKTLYILDPDSKYLMNPKAKNLLALPGECLIEKLIHNFLDSHAEDTDLWSELGMNYANCMARYNNIENDPNNNNDQEKKKQYKDWFIKNINNNKFGRNGSTVFKIWATHNKELCYAFCNEVLEALLFVDSRLVQAQYNQLKKKIKDKFNK